jgi:acetyl-CoA carboxylase biotin carboxyl carrier protein
MINLALLKELLALLDSSGATTIKVRRWFTTYEVSRSGRPTAPAPVVGDPIAPPPPGEAPVHATHGGAPVGGAVTAPPSRLLDVKSPMVGTFYRAPEPGAEPYVKAGSRVSAGQTLCIIEAMKIMNEIESEMTGSVREILVEDAQPVEFGQVLFRVEPHG